MNSSTRHWQIGAALAAMTLLCSGSAYAGPIGAANLIDPATLHAGTVVAGSPLTWVSGGNGLQGTADGINWVQTSPGETTAAALASVDHHWAQYDPYLVLFSATALNAVLAIPAIDHGWTLNNDGAEFYEPFEFRIFGCDAAIATATCVEGVITDVWARGVDNAGAMLNADDYTSRWAFQSSYNYFRVASGDRLVNGPWSPGEGEIDALTAVPEPATLSLLGLGLLGLVRSRRRRV